MSLRPVFMLFCSVFIAFGCRSVSNLGSYAHVFQNTSISLTEDNGPSYGIFPWLIFVVGSNEFDLKARIFVPESQAISAEIVHLSLVAKKTGRVLWESEAGLPCTIEHRASESTDSHGDLARFSLKGIENLSGTRILMKGEVECVQGDGGILLHSFEFELTHDRDFSVDPIMF